MRRYDLLAARDDARGARGPAAVRRRVLGRTGLAVSPIGFGAWAIGGNRFGNSYGPTDDAESLRAVRRAATRHRDRKSTRLNSSHLVISYAVFCLKKKKH